MPNFILYADSEADGMGAVVYFPVPLLPLSDLAGGVIKF